MPSEAKEAIDALTALLGASGLSGIAIAIFGWLQAKKHNGLEAAAAQPSVSRATMGHLGGMMVNDHAARTLADSVDRMAAAYETDARQARDHSDVLHGDMRNLTDAVSTLSKRIEDRG